MEKKVKKINWPQIIVGLTMILCGMALAIYKINYAGLQCDTRECFMAAANECQNVEFISQEKIGTVQYRSKDCVFKKTLVRTDGNELPELKALLEGKSLTCEYAVGQFDKRWMTTLIYGINYCEGDLKENIGSLLLFVEPAG
jgi:hypothetical protein